MIADELKFLSTAGQTRHDIEECFKNGTFLNVLVFCSFMAEL
jgi:hypothetical protein